MCRAQFQHPQLTLCGGFMQIQCRGIKVIRANKCWAQTNRTVTALTGLFV